MKNIVALVSLAFCLNTNALEIFPQNVNYSSDSNFSKSSLAPSSVQQEEEKDKKKKKKRRKHNVEKANGTTLINEKISISDENQPVDKKKKKKK